MEHPHYKSQQLHFGSSKYFITVTCTSKNAWPVVKKGNVTKNAWPIVKKVKSAYSDGVYPGAHHDSQFRFIKPLIIMISIGPYIVVNS